MIRRVKGDIQHVTELDSFPKEIRIFPFRQVVRGQEASEVADGGLEHVDLLVVAVGEVDLTNGFHSLVKVIVQTHEPEGIYGG